MATFVLVHGAWHGGWCWRDVVPLLRAQGHTVFAPTLTGSGERLHQSHHGVTLETHIRDVIGVIEAEELSDVVLVGHSYGGMVITGVADRLPDRIAQLVYLDAFVPAHGDSLIGLINQALPPEVAAHYMGAFYGGAVLNDHAGLIPPLSGELFGATPATAAWMARRCTPQPLATFTTPLLLSGAGAALPRVYLLAEGWQPSPFHHFARQVADQPGWRSAGLPGGHGLMMDSPAALTQALMQQL